MKTKTFIVALFGVAITADMALAACNVVTCSQSATYEYETNMQTGRATATTPLCVQNSTVGTMIFPNDTACKNRYVVVSGTEAVDGGYANALNVCTDAEKASILAQIHACEVDCSDSQRGTWDCNDSTTNITGGKVSVTTWLTRKTADSCYCNYTITTKCNDTYYGNRTNASQPGTCTQCPLMSGTDAVGWTKGTAGTVITHCHIPANNTINDGTGNFYFTEDCYYSNK